MNNERVLLLEAAWEVCNQVGGIYQVLRSKVGFMTSQWNERYVLVGPYVPSKAATDFESCEPPALFREVMESLAREGIEAHFGHWLVSGRPQVILLNYVTSRDKLNVLKHDLWQCFGVESPEQHELLDNAIGFGRVVARAASVVCRAAEQQGLRTLLHCHEWQGGVAIPLLRKEGAPCSLVFTTHATMLGRYIASSNDDLYQTLSQIDVLAQAQHYDIKSQHLLEQCCANQAHTFTTVSPLTGEECQYLLGKTPDVITPNGIDTKRYDVGHDFQTLHAQHKEYIRRFVMGHFFPSYSFDLDKTLFFFTSGRYEPHNKGFDLCLQAIARLNEELKAQKVDVTVVFFIVTNRPTQSLNPHALRDRGVLEELRSVSEKIGSALSERLFMSGASGEDAALDSLADDYWMVRFRRTRYALRSDRLPFTTTHILADESQDEVLSQIRELKLTNAEEDPVKVVYHPQFINSVNPLWRMEYEQFVRGCHMGIFPSSYEPWGYTPLECVCMGVPAITSDLSGFGRYLSDLHPDHDRHGVLVLGRRMQDFRSSAQELANRLLAFCRLNRRQRIALRNLVETHSHSFDWNKLGASYQDAHELALRRESAQR